MKNLSSLFGMNIHLNNITGTLETLNDNISWEEYSRKYSDKMIGLLADPDFQTKDEPYYDFYKAIIENDKRQLFEFHGLRYDSTVIFGGNANGEYKKTAGHFHLPINEKPYSYPELYQVIYGKALFVMQHVADYKTNNTIEVDDIILAEVNAGEAVVIPPDYGHCTINIGDDTMVFINLVSIQSNNFYDSVKENHGMCIYAWKDGSNYRLEKNKRYNIKCEPKIVTPVDCPELGIKKDIPIYNKFLANPTLFNYLNTPEEKQHYFLDMLKAK